MSVDNLECVDDFGIDTEGELRAIEVGGVHRLEVNLVSAVLHAHHGDVAAVEELGVALVVSLSYSLLEAEVALAVAGEDAVVALSLGEEGVGLHDRLEVNAEVGVLDHNAFVLYDVMRSLAGHVRERREP